MLGFEEKVGTRTVVGLMIATLLVADLFVQSAIEKNVDSPIPITLLSGILVGQFIGQLNLISVWAAVSPGSLLTRLPWALLMTSLMWAAYVVRLPGISASDSAATVGMLLAIGCVVAQVPLWLASRIFRWRLLSSTNDDLLAEHQFNLGQMFLGTVLLAASLAVGRIIVQSSAAVPSAGWLFDWQAYCFLVAFILANLFLVVPCIWAAFYVAPTAKSAGIAIAVAAAITGLQFGGLCLVIGGPGRDHFEWWAYFFAIALGEMTVVYGCLRLLKTVVGFRFVRISNVSEHAMSGSPQ